MELLCLPVLPTLGAPYEGLAQLLLLLLLLLQVMTQMQLIHMSLPQCVCVYVRAYGYGVERLLSSRLPAAARAQYMLASHARIFTSSWQQRKRTEDKVVANTAAKKR